MNEDKECVWRKAYQRALEQPRTEVFTKSYEDYGCGYCFGKNQQCPAYLSQLEIKIWDIFMKDNRREDEQNGRNK